MNEFSRIIGVFVSPGKAFADIAQRPKTWWVPLVIAAIVGFIYLNAYSKKVGFEQLIRQQLDRAPQTQNMTPQQREQAIAFGSRIGTYTTYGGGLIGPFFGAVILAIILMFVFDTIMSAGIGLLRMLAIVSYAYLPNVILSVLAMIVLFLKPPEDFDLQNPVATNLGAFMSMDSPAWLRSLGTSMDLFSIWVLVLLAIGIAAASRKMSVGKALGGLIPLWLLWVVCRMGLATLRGS